MNIPVKQNVLTTTAVVPVAIVAIGLMSVFVDLPSDTALAQTTENVSKPDTAAKKPATRSEPDTDDTGYPTLAGTPDKKASDEVQSTMPVDRIVQALKAAPKQVVGKIYSVDEIQKDYTIMSLMQAVEIRTLGFEFDSYDVMEMQAKHLNNIGDAIVSMLKDSPEEVFFIEGHADLPGEEAYNLSLSQKRAFQVKRALTDVFGVPEKNIVAAGFGEKHPKVKTEAREQKNRRVTVRRITPLVKSNR